MWKCPPHQHMSPLNPLAVNFGYGGLVPEGLNVYKVFTYVRLRAREDYTRVGTLIAISEMQRCETSVHHSVFQYFVELRCGSQADLPRRPLQPYFQNLYFYVLNVFRFVVTVWTGLQVFCGTLLAGKGCQQSQILIRCERGESLYYILSQVFW